MITKTKIKIDDVTELRALLDKEYVDAGQIELSKYAILLAKHILELTQYKNINNTAITDGLVVIEKWQRGNAKVKDIRQASFKLHDIARACTESIDKVTFRIIGQAIAVAHMKEHAMVASDYSVKLINLLFPNDITSVKQERLWQIETLKNVKLSSKILLS